MNKRTPILVVLLLGLLCTAWLPSARSATPTADAPGQFVSESTERPAVGLPNRPLASDAEPASTDAVLPPGISPEWWSTVQAEIASETARTRRQPNIALGGDFLGESSGDEFATSVVPAGDVNADGYADALVGAPGYLSETGKVYLYLGSPAGLSSAPAWTAVGETAGDRFGSALAGGGDVDGDGYADVVIGAPGYLSDTGRAYLYRGSPAGLSLSPDWTDTGESSGSYFGAAVAMAGDVDNDTYADVLVGSPGYLSATGKAYLYTAEMPGLLPGLNWTATGETAGDRFGSAVAGAGDVDGDSYADILIGAPDYAISQGKAYLYRGSPGGPSLLPDWSDVGEGGHFGQSLAAAGNVDADGYADIVVAAWDDTLPSAGYVYLYRGTVEGPSLSPDWTAYGRGPDSRFGYTVAAAGDVNADGYGDLLIGDGEMQAWLYLGSVEGLAQFADWTALGDSPAAPPDMAVAGLGDVDGDGYGDLILGSSGYGNGQGRAWWYRGAAAVMSLTWKAGGENELDFFGTVATAGDVNGDGYSDALVGAWGYGGLRGKAYLYLGSAEGFSPDPVWTATGEDAENGFGAFLAGVGDVNGDGYADIAIGAPGYDVNRGKVYVYLGSAEGPHTVPDWTAAGQWSGDEFAHVAAAGDVNGDGYADLLVGAPYAYASGFMGRAYLYLGSPSGPSTTPDWSASGEAVGDSFAYALAGAGDVDGDGYADILIGAPQFNYGYGRAYLYRGSAAGPSATPDWTATGVLDGLGFAEALAGAGDVDGDGYADLLIGAPYADQSAGQAYLYRGSPAGPSPNPDWTFTGRYEEYLGGALAPAGDVNADGYADLLIGGIAGGLLVREMPEGGPSAMDGLEYTYGQGRAYLYLGSPLSYFSAPAWTATGVSYEFLGGSLAAAGDVDGDGYADVLIGGTGYMTATGRVLLFRGAAAVSSLEVGWTATSENPGDNFGFVAAAGDVNGDGYADALVGAPGYDNDRGKAYLYLGAPSGLSLTPYWTATGENQGDGFAYALAGAGDVNGDGYADLLVGAWGYDNGRGKAYLYLGSVEGPAFSPDWTATGENQGDGYGHAVAGAGDVNGDGYADLLIGADYYNGDYGRAYLYLGSPAGPSLAPDWTITGETSGDYLGMPVAAAGDVNGDGYGDVLVTSYGHLSETGRVDLYLGSLDGLAPTPAWSALGEASGDWFGWPAASAGDVNGDGYADIAVGAGSHANSRGKVYLYLGSPAGPGPTPDWTALGEVEGDAFGYVLSSAGDTNGDGYADLLVGAPFYGDGNYGRAYLYAGSAMGLAALPAWSFTGTAWGGLLGIAVAGAGDTNGDGYADILVTASFNPGEVLLYYGNGGHGVDSCPGQWRADGTAPIAPLGLSDSATAVQLRLTGRSPAGRDRVKLQWQIAPLGMPFTATGVISGTSAEWTDTLTGGVTLSATVEGLTQGMPYHWRVRLLYHPNGGLGRPAGPWMSLPLGGREEKAFRTADGPIGTLMAHSDPVTPLGQTTHLTATVTPPSLYLRYDWSFGDGEVGRGAIVTHTYAAAGLYTAVVTASNSVDLLTATVNVLVEEPPAGLQVTSNAPTALGQPTVFTATVSAGISVTYEWDFGDGRHAAGTPDGGTLAASAVVSHTYAAAGRYTATVTASTALGSVWATTTVAIEEPVSNLAAANDSPTALGWPTTLWAEAAGTDVAYAWDLGDGSTASGALITHTYAEAGTYLAVVTASNSVSTLTATTTVLVVAGEIPIAGLTATSNSPTVVGYVTQLRAQVTAGTNVSYTWSLGDGTTAGGAQVAHVYPTPGIYAAVVTASNSVSQMTATTVVSVAVAIPLDPRWGGRLTFSDTQGLTTTVQAPPGAVTQTTLLAYFPLLTPTQELTPGLSFARHAFHLYVWPRFFVYIPICEVPSAGPPKTASRSTLGIMGTGGVLPAGQLSLDGFSFLKPVTLTIQYSDEDVAGLDENALRLLYWDGISWADSANTCAPPSAYFRDLEANILRVAICHLTEFAMVGQ